MDDTSPTETRKCACCLNIFTRKEYWEHYYPCRSKNTIPALDLRRNQYYIPEPDGKKYKISEIGHIFRRNRTRQINAVIVHLYCDEDHTTIRRAFRWDQRFRVDEYNDIWIQ